MKPLAFAFFAAALPTPAGAAFESALSPEMHRHVQAGLDAIYTMDFSAAEAQARKLIELKPEHPQGSFALASVAWTRYVYDTEESDPSLIDPYEKKTWEAVAVAESWLKAHPDDPEAMMLMGSAYGLSSRLLVMRREWLKAYWNGRKAVGLLRDTVKLAPDYWDAYLGIGMYDYYTDVYQQVVRVLAKILFGGSRLRGIETLKQVADKGRYSKYAAQLLLVEIYNMDQFGAKDPPTALAIMKEIRKVYPQSPMLHAAEIVSLYECGRLEEALAGARFFLKAVKDGKYRPIDQAKGSVMLGTILWAQGKHDQALAAFETASGVRHKEKLTRWAVWALTRAGQLEDVKGRRAQALALYKASAAEPDLWGMRFVSKAGLSRPFRRDASPGPIQPP